jgi:eukaryotic-like serine/threonine-protein kinase
VLSQLNHPNIASFHDMFQVDGRPCLVMEYVDGETLFERICRCGKLDVLEALAILEQIVAALDYLHRSNVLHRDLKSANIKISSRGEVKLLDFGIAKFSSVPGITAVGAIMGTPEYLAPEQIQGQPAGIATEIWMVGLLAYEMLTGHLPFQASNDLELFRKVRSEDPQPVSAYQSDIPASVDRLVQKCLHKNPARRFASPEDLIRAIRKAAAKVSSWRGSFLALVVADILALPYKFRLRVVMFVVTMVLFFAYDAIRSRVKSGPDVRIITIDVAEGSADVYRDGSNVGTTPYQVRARLGEFVQLELRKSGFADQSVQFDVTERNTYSYTMQPAR